MRRCRCLRRCTGFRRASKSSRTDSCKPTDPHLPPELPPRAAAEPEAAAGHGLGFALVALAAAAEAAEAAYQAPALAVVPLWVWHQGLISGSSNHPRGSFPEIAQRQVPRARDKGRQSAWSS